MANIKNQLLKYAKEMKKLEMKLADTIKLQVETES